MYREIKTKKGLEELLRRYLNNGASTEWINTIKGCLKEGLAMDYIDFQNTPKDLKPLWKGLK